MPTLNTLFKKIYGEALAPYGFVKIKGRQPYFLRLIGDEIIHVITFAPEFTTNLQNKAFDILGGVATVYRGALTLENSPYRNVNWLTSNSSIYCKHHPYLTEDEKRYRKSIRRFEYEKDNEEEMIKAVYDSLDVTKKIMLPELDKAVDLRSCLEYYTFFRLFLLTIYTDEDFGQQWNDGQYNEGLLQLMVYSVDEYEEIRKKSYDSYLKDTRYMMEIGKSEMTEKDFHKEKKLVEKKMYERIEKFKFLTDNPEQHARVMKELEKRKAENTARLREYGLDV